LKSKNHHGAAITELHRQAANWKVSKQRLKWDILEGVSDGGRFGHYAVGRFQRWLDNAGSGFFRGYQDRRTPLEHSTRFPAPAMESAQNLRVITEDGNSDVLDR